MRQTHFIDRDPNIYEALTELQKENVQSMNEEQVLRFIENFEFRWYLHNSDGVIPCMERAAKLGYRQFIHPDYLNEDGIPYPDKIDIMAIRGFKNRMINYLIQLNNHVQIHEKEYSYKDDITISKRINNIILQIEDGFENVRRHQISFDRVIAPTALPRVPVYTDPSTMDDEEIEKATAFQKCLIITLKEAYRAGYRRYKGHCCEEIKTVDGYRTRAWNPVFTIEEFVYSLPKKESNFVNWKNFTSKGSIFRDVIDNISKCQDAQFPEIKKRRHVWSFKNGVFVGKEWIPDRGVYDCRFYPYKSEKYACLDPSIVACKYFDQQFDDFSHVEDWTKIPTPYFESVLKYQKLDDDVCNWAYVMGGRLCFDVGEMDGWQVIPFFKGIARSGKSTLITKVFKKFYENEDVGTLSNNIEKKFGLSAIKDAFMFIAPEVKGDLALEQAEFQSIVSGEDVSVAVKNKTAVSIEWKVPGVLGGNEVPNWKDNSGSVLRRILPWNFGIQVSDADIKLDEKLNNELPIILLKCVRAYLDYANKYGSKDIWNVVPKYFKKIQKQVAMVASSLTNFLESTNVVLGEELFVPQKDFIAKFNQHCKENNLGNHKFHQDFYAGPFSSRNIEVRVETVKYKGRICKNQPIIYGLDVVSDDLTFTDDI
jgi:hypothetical protein|uniref:SF3 helicase domain-containing protein n=1 Tax=Mantoniella tinhauana virus 1 TaxID=3111543 RepID=A0AB38ZM19_9VIRU